MKLLAGGGCVVSPPLLSCDMLRGHYPGGGGRAPVLRAQTSGLTGPGIAPATANIAIAAQQLGQELPVWSNAPASGTHALMWMPMNLPPHVTAPPEEPGTPAQSARPISWPGEKNDNSPCVGAGPDLRRLCQTAIAG